MLVQPPTESVILVDENDQPTGYEEKLKAHEKGLLHRAFSVFIYAQKAGKTLWLLQKRQENKYHCRGLWSNTCCSHPRPNETPINAAMRRLKEEMGFCVPLTSLGYFIYSATLDTGLIEHELDHVFIGEYHGESIYLNPDEVSDFKWLETKQLSDDLASNPQQYTPWLTQVFQKCL